jgi:hypothetical protein
MGKAKDRGEGANGQEAANGHEAGNGRRSKAVILAEIDKRIQGLLESRSPSETVRLQHELIQLNEELVEERERELA